MPRALPRFEQAMERARDLERIAKILVEGGELPEDLRGKPIRASADGHRDDRRRGLPMIGRGVSGAINHTDPLRALIAKESRPRRR